MILLDPKHLDRPYPDARSAEIMRKTVEFFEAKGKTKLLEDYYAVAHLRVRRDPGLLRAPVLVHLAGLGPRPRPHLDERQRRSPQARRAGARGGRHLRLRPLREDARRRHLLHRHGPLARRRRMAREREQVLHRQRQRGRDGLHLRPARRRGRVRLLRRRPATRVLPPGEERRGEPELRLGVRAARLPRPRGGHPPPRARRLERRSQHGERRQVQPRLGLDRDLHPLRCGPPTTCAPRRTRTAATCSTTRWSR
jgi:hypothetical protein